MSVDTDKGIEEIPRDTDTLRHDCCLLVFTQQRLEDYCNIFVQLKFIVSFLDDNLNFEFEGTVQLDLSGVKNGIIR